MVEVSLGTESDAMTAGGYRVKMVIVVIISLAVLLMVGAGMVGLIHAKKAGDWCMTRTPALAQQADLVTWSWSWWPPGTTCLYRLSDGSVVGHDIGLLP